MDIQDLQDFLCLYRTVAAIPYRHSRVSGNPGKDTATVPYRHSRVSGNPEVA